MRLVLITFILLITLSAEAQDNSFNVYNPILNGTIQVNNAAKEAMTNEKHLLLIIGGNWCKWCRMFDKFSHENAKIDSALTANYVVVHINYSKENENEELLKTLEYPQRFGFPVFVVLNADGRRLHTQNTAYLEDGQGYSEKKVLGFLNDWSVKSLKYEK
jgi:thioredoxin-related protein